MDAETSASEPLRRIDPPRPTTSPRRGASTANRMGLAVISIVSLIFLINIVAYLSGAFGQIGGAIVVAAACLTILGINVAFNFDLIRPRS